LLVIYRNENLFIDKVQYAAAVGWLYIDI